jgi:hypothetical protein
MFAPLARLPDTLGIFGLIFWGGVLLALLIAVGVLIVIEQRMFRARGKGGGALFVRLCSWPILALTVAAVLFAARAVSGWKTRRCSMARCSRWRRCSSWPPSPAALVTSSFNR